MATGTLERPRSDVDPRIEARRRHVERSRSRQRRRWLFVFAAAVSMVALSWWATRSALLDVDRVVVQGGPHTNDDDIALEAGIRPGEPLLDIEPEATRQRIRTLPWVDDVSVRVRWDGDVDIAITERTPVAAVATGYGSWVLTDASGRALELTDSPADLVVIEGVAPVDPGQDVPPSASGALSIAGQLSPGLRSRVVAIVVAPDGELSLRVRPSGTVVFGPATEVEAKLRSLRTLFAQVDDTGLLQIDVRVPDTPSVVRAAPPPPPQGDTSSAGDGGSDGGGGGAGDGGTGRAGSAATDGADG